MNYEYECALTGLTQEGGVDNDSDGLGDLPVGWTRVHLTRRAYNPQWVMLQQVKEAMIENMLESVPPEMREMQAVVLKIQVDAQFYALEQDTPMYLPDIDDVVYISDEGAIVETVNELRELLGLDPLVSAEEEEEDFDEGEGEDLLSELSEVGDSGDGDDFDDFDDEDDEDDE